MTSFKKILFICMGNTCRSQMAEGFARAYGGERVDAKSAGTSAMGVVNADTIDAMRAIRIDISKHASKQLTDEMLNWADVVVAMAGQGAGGLVRPGFKGRKLDWDIQDPLGHSPEFMESVRDDIGKRVRTLIDEECRDVDTRR